MCHNSYGSGGQERMGRLYDNCVRIQEYIEQNNLDVFRTRGALALQCGFLITLVGADDPDDSGKLESLRKAAKEVLGLDLS